MKKKCAAAYYELIIKTLVFMTLIATAVSFFGAFTAYLNLNYAARRVTRAIEISGQVTEAAEALFRTFDANAKMGENAQMSVSAAYYKPAQKKIQLRQTFTVTCRSEYRLNVFTPTGGEPVGFRIPLCVRLTGMSEKFWK